MSKAGKAYQGQCQGEPSRQRKHEHLCKKKVTFSIQISSHNISLQVTVLYVRFLLSLIESRSFGWPIASLLPSSGIKYTKQ